MDWSWEGLNIYQTVHAHSLLVSLLHMFAHGMELGRSEHPQNRACTLVACQSVCVLHTFAHGMGSEHPPNSACTLVACQSVCVLHMFNGMELGRSEHLPNCACTLVACQSVCVCC